MFDILIGRDDDTNFLLFGRNRCAGLELAHNHTMEPGEFGLFGLGEFDILTHLLFEQPWERFEKELDVVAELLCGLVIGRTAFVGD